MNRNKVEELIEDLKINKQSREKLIKLHQEKVDMLDFIIDELKEALSND